MGGMSLFRCITSLTNRQRSAQSLDFSCSTEILIADQTSMVLQWPALFGSVSRAGG